MGSLCSSTRVEYISHYFLQLKDTAPDYVYLSQQYGGYITDITRTWPIAGKFTAAQNDLYTAVLSTQRACIALCRASATVSLDKLHDIAESTLRDQLIQLGFDISGRVCLLYFPLPALFFGAV